MNTADTIIAVASAPPPAVRAVVRVSGPAALQVLSGVSRADTASIVDHVMDIDGLSISVRAYVFHAPRSYTGQDVVEMHLPGSPWIVERLLTQLTAAGLRMAGPGEFTARAFLNGKMDLTAAEGVAAAVSAADGRQLRAARQLMAGALAARVLELMEELGTLLALLEAGIDFSDEDVSFIGTDALAAGIAAAEGKVGEIIAEGARFGRISGSPTVVLAGRPNAGKSTLMNALLGRPRAVVSAVSGTTRDVIWDDLVLTRGTARLTDVAGLEEGGKDDEIEQQMQRRARDAIEQADVLVYVRDEVELELSRAADLVVVSKSDLGATARDGELAVSGLGGAGISELRRRLDALCFGSEGGAGLALTTRHLGHLRRARELLKTAAGAVGAGDELVAASLRAALDELGEITGAVSPDEILGKVFSTFCIGK